MTSRYDCNDHFYARVFLSFIDALHDGYTRQHRVLLSILFIHFHYAPRQCNNFSRVDSCSDKTVERVAAGRILNWQDSLKTCRRVNLESSWSVLTRQCNLFAEVHS